MKFHIPPKKPEFSLWNHAKISASVVNVTIVGIIINVAKHRRTAVDSLLIVQ